jgi:23S rRNA pseudouridine2605 synthase
MKGATHQNENSFRQPPCSRPGFVPTGEPGAAAMTERLQKILARNSFGSRREVEEWISAGRILLNGQPASLGDRFSPGDRVAIDGKDITRRLAAEAPVLVLAYNKPQHQPVLPHAEHLEASVTEKLPASLGSRWLAINRMQPDDSGLLLLTNSGELADALMRQRHKISAAYMVRVHTPVPDAELSEIPLSFRYQEETVEFTKIESAGGSGTNRWYRVEMNRMDRGAAIRDLFASCGLQISRTVQVAFGTLELPRTLPRTHHRPLTAQELSALYALAGLQPVAAAAAPKAARERSSRSAPRAGAQSRAVAKKRFSNPGKGKRFP